MVIEGQADGKLMLPPLVLMFKLGFKSLLVTHNPLATTTLKIAKSEGNFLLLECKT